MEDSAPRYRVLRMGKGRSHRMSNIYSIYSALFQIEEQKILGLGLISSFGMRYGRLFGLTLSLLRNALASVGFRREKFGTRHYLPVVNFPRPIGIPLRRVSDKRQWW